MGTAAHGGSRSAAALLTALGERGLTLATAESLTGGGLGALLTSVAGASAVYRGGVVAYATDLKRQVLGVPEEVVARHGVVSAECAEAMAEGVRRVTGASLAISTTGVAGPDPQDDQPVGRVFVCVAGAAGVRGVRLDLAGDRERIRGAACDAAVEAAREHWREVVGWTTT